MSDTDDDFSLGLPLFEVADRLWDFAERITAIDVGSNLFGFSQFLTMARSSELTFIARAVTFRCIILPSRGPSSITWKNRAVEPPTRT